MEVFPPKQKDKYESIEKATEEIASYKPGFMSVTYGAGGGTSEFTVSIASNLEKKYDIPLSDEGSIYRLFVRGSPTPFALNEDGLDQFMNWRFLDALEEGKEDFLEISRIR